MRGTSGFLRDNLEAFAVAIAMALVIRHYCIEAFRIPTMSMNPTLLGDYHAADGSRRHGDRILVDKFVYLWRDPRRFEVIVFRYPLNASKNFIKRLVGLPGEWLRIVDGDIWTSSDEGETWSIQRKPEGVQDQLFFPYYPEPADDVDAFRSTRVWVKEGTGWTLDEADRCFDVDAGDETAVALFDANVQPFGLPPNGLSSPPYVGDVRVRFSLRVERAGTLEIVIQEHGLPHRLVLGADESFAVIATDGGERRLPVDLALRAGQEFDVSFANADDALLVCIEGDDDVSATFLFPEPEDKQPPLPRIVRDDQHANNRIAIEARGIKASLRDVCIDRDLHYDWRAPEPTKIWKIPADGFFVLGDNTGSSKDSRAWNVQEAHAADGTVYRWEFEHGGGDNNNPPGGRPRGPADQIVTIEADVDGLVRRFNASDIVSWKTGVEAPIVPRENLIGRAFVIFWPIYTPPVYSGRTRIALIR